jgi:steroid 5-alpha reductase family enzyme
VSIAYPTGRGLATVSRAGAFAVVAGSYLAAGAAALLAVGLLPRADPITTTLAADLVATGVVFAASMLLANSSVYDPYWSVVPPVVAVAWAAAGPDGLPSRRLVVVALVVAWGMRLTGNWARSWTGLGQEDWRYIQLREQTAGRLPWWLVSLGGIQLMPTLVVFAGMLPLWPALTGSRPIGLLDLAALAVTAVAIAVETVADLQLHRFIGDPANRGKVADRGLWAYSRHPNYLGEIGFWWGLWLFGLAADPSWWWTVAGPLVMVLLFATASIPLMDRRSLQRRPGYAEYLRRVPLIPRPRRRRHRAPE